MAIISATNIGLHRMQGLRQLGTRFYSSANQLLCRLHNIQPGETAVIAGLMFSGQLSNPNKSELLSPFDIDSVTDALQYLGTRPRRDKYSYAKASDLASLSQAFPIRIDFHPEKRRAVYDPYKNDDIPGYDIELFGQPHAVPRLEGLADIKSILLDKATPEAVAHLNSYLVCKEPHLTDKEIKLPAYVPRVGITVIYKDGSSAAGGRGKIDSSFTALGGRVNKCLRRIHNTALPDRFKLLIGSPQMFASSPPAKESYPERKIREDTFGIGHISEILPLAELVDKMDVQ